MYKEVIPSLELIKQLILDESFRGVVGIQCSECCSIEDDQYCCTGCWDFSKDAHGRIMIHPIIEALIEPSENQSEFNGFDKSLFSEYWLESMYSGSITIDGGNYVGFISQHDIVDFDGEYDSLVDVFFIDVERVVSRVLSI